MRNILLALFLLVISSLSVHAVGVSAPYWMGNPVALEPGEEKIVTLELQNMVGGEDLKLRAYFKQESEVAEFVDADTDYDLPFGTQDLKVNIIVKVPNNAQIGQKYLVDLAFRSVSSGNGDGPVQLAAEIGKKFEVLVIERPKATAQAVSRESGYSGYSLLAVLVLIILAWLLFHRKHKNNK